jgi:hypothetical protein
MQSMMNTHGERSKVMSSQANTIRQQFLAQACRYLFGPTASCESFLRLGIPSLQPIPVRHNDRR